MPNSAVQETEALTLEAGQIRDMCKGMAKGLKETCYAREFEKITAASGHSHAFDVLFELQKLDDDALGCHFIAHAIGYGAYKTNPEKGRELIATINPTCGYGAPMGIIELYVARRLTDKAVVRDTCPENTTPGDCNHIVGHILLVETRNNISAALELCSAFNRSNRVQNCLNGVFMENIIGLNLIAHNLSTESEKKNWAARLENLTELCRSHSGDAAAACWRELPHAIAARYRLNASAIFGHCSSSNDSRAAWGCKMHAVDILNAQMNFNMTKARHICALPQPEPDFAAACYMQVLDSWLAMRFLDKSPAAEYCSSIIEELRGKCFERLGSAAANIRLPESFLDGA